MTKASAGGERLPFRDGTFDAAWSLGVLCTVADKVAVLTELRRVVRPGGPLGLPVRPWVVSVGEPLAPPEGTEPGDPLAAAELAEQARAAIADMLRQ